MKTTTNVDKPLTEYQAGFLDALWLYAHWKDGVAYVGSTGKTYKLAREEFLNQGRLHASPTERSLR